MNGLIRLDVNVTGGAHEWHRFWHSRDGNFKTFKHWYKPLLTHYMYNKQAESARVAQLTENCRPIQIGCHLVGLSLSWLSPRRFVAQMTVHPGNIMRSVQNRHAGRVFETCIKCLLLYNYVMSWLILIVILIGCQQSSVRGSCSRLWVRRQYRESAHSSDLGSTVWRLLQRSSDYHWYIHYWRRKYVMYTTYYYLKTHSCLLQVCTLLGCTNFDGKS